MENIIRVGIGILVVKDGKVLYGKRKSKHGLNTYAPPGGHLEYGETIQNCAIRELFEESNLRAKIQDIVTLPAIDDIFPNQEKHYVTIISVIKTFSGVVENKEPEKLEKWEWLTWEDIKNLGEKNFLPMQNLFKQYPEFDPTK